MVIIPMDMVIIPMDMVIIPMDMDHHILNFEATFVVKYLLAFSSFPLAIFPSVRSIILLVWATQTELPLQVQLHFF